MPLNRLEHLLDMLRKQPDDPFLIYAAGVEYEAMGDMANARLFFEELLVQHPGYLPVYYKYGVMLALAGEMEKAGILFQKGMKLAEELKDMKTLREIRAALENLD